MTENKKTSKSSFWQRFSQTLKSSKRIFIYFFLFIIFFLPIFILWNKYNENKMLSFPKVEVKVESSKPLKEMAATTEVVQKHTQESSQKLITIQLLEGVLEGWIPLPTFKTYLQQHSDEDTPNLLLELSTLSNCPTYTELQSSLPSAPVKSKSLWERLKSFIRIKKIDRGKASETSSPKEIEKAIYEKNIPVALNLFEKLPENKKEYFSSWIKKVQERLKVEILYKNLMMKLAQAQESSQKLTTIQLLEGVLGGWIHLFTFKTYLQQHFDEDTSNLLLELSTLSNCPTYTELQSSLPSAPVKSKSLWERLKSLIRINKIDRGKASETSSPKEIEKAIYEKNIPVVLNLFEKLPENEKEYFSSWIKKVQERLKVEMLYKNLLMKLAQGQNG